MVFKPKGFGYTNYSHNTSVENQYNLFMHFLVTIAKSQHVVAMDKCEIVQINCCPPSIQNLSSLNTHDS